MSSYLITHARIGTLLVTVMLVGCVTTPQTRDELKTTMKEHPSLSIADSYTTNRPFEEVVGMLERKWKECYSVRNTTTRTEGGMTKSKISDTYHPKSHKVNNSLVEMTLQMTTEGATMLNKVPPGGEYRVALDIVRLAGNKTKLSWYSTAGWADTWEINKQWSDGKNVACEQ